ncbi:MAG TPA: GNAT family N-acetyltransferase [Polyangiaceae bacterium]|nr:GNAT family N-acetyltransferase [Polyangiaceae bacterium]
MQIQKLTATDVLLARALFPMMAQVFSEPCDELSDAYLQGLLGRESFWAFAALAEEQVVGGLTGYLLPMTRRETHELFIYDVAVREDYQRRGVGRALMRAAIQAANGIGAQNAFVPADAEDDHALRFYRALGGTAAESTIFTFPNVTP